MPVESQRWDPSTPGFVTAVFRTLVTLVALVIAAGTLIELTMWHGLLSGGVLAIILFVIAMRAGQLFAQSHSYARTMLWLLLSQFVLWVGMAVMLAVLKVDPVGFVISVSALPVAIICTLFWYLIQQRRLSV